MQHRIAEPIGEISLAAAVARCRRRRLRRAIRVMRGTLDPDVEVIVVSIHRPDLRQPAAVAAGIAAQRLLDRGVDEDALDLGILRGGLDYFLMSFAPDLRIDIEPIV